ncbi:MAG: hypothetical protein NPIRA04_14520 [Nitrospirales bacterium]|nr:MAG: hypothetical protein NPIRA04_14520 [Nitrospirales bacterium]
MEISPTTLPYQPSAHLPEARANTNSRKDGLPSSDDENAREETAKLRARDKQVRAHEQAHSAAAGGLAKGGASFTYERGPDGRQYAVGGEVNIDTSPVPGNPEATIRKAQQIRSAALAPADPSSQDRAVAASTATLEAQARQELQEEREEESSDSSHSSSHPKIDIFV